MSMLEHINFYKLQPVILLAEDVHCTFYMCTQKIKEALKYWSRLVRSTYWIKLL